MTAIVWQSTRKFGRKMMRMAIKATIFEIVSAWNIRNATRTAPINSKRSLYYKLFCTEQVSHGLKRIPRRGSVCVSGEIIAISPSRYRFNRNNVPPIRTWKIEVSSRCSTWSLLTASFDVSILKDEFKRRTTDDRCDSLLDKRIALSYRHEEINTVRARDESCQVVNEFSITLTHVRLFRVEIVHGFPNDSSEFTWIRF